MTALQKSLSRFAAALIAFAVVGSAVAVQRGEVAPAWRADDFAGKSVEFPAVAGGKPAVVVFWATWCSYCKVFMPYLKGIQADYAAHGVKIVMIDVKEERAGASDPRAYIRSLGFAPIAIADGDAIAAQWNIQTVPGLLIVDGDGTVAYRRPSTDLPAGKTVAELWNAQVRAALDEVVGR